MSSGLAPPASFPPVRWATLTDALLAEMLRLLAGHDRHPLPGTILRHVDHELGNPALVAVLNRARAQG
jgi:hypothetical protein